MWRGITSDFYAGAVLFGGGKHRRDLAHRVTLLELYRRQVDGHRHAQAAFIVPDLQLAAGGLQDPAVNACNKPALWVLPAHQRLQPDGGAIRAAALGLVVQHLGIVKVRWFRHLDRTGRAARA